MKRFSRLCQQLESVPFHRSKSELLAAYLREAPAQDADWGLYLLLGGQLPRLLAPASLEQWIRERAGLPEWLVNECREQAADLAETAALLGELRCGPIAPEDQAPLAYWIEERLLPMARLPAFQRDQAIAEAVRGWWDGLSIDVSWALHALALGRFPVHVSRRVIEDAASSAWSGDAVTSLDDRLRALPAAGKPLPATQLDLF